MSITITMPRQTIPQRAKKMQTYDVNITQTTEEQIWNHIQIKLNEIQPLQNEARIKQNDMINLVFDSNPYQNCNWRKNPPKHIEFLEWMDGNEKWYDYIRLLFEIRHDVKLCIDIFNWYETKPEEVSQLEHEVIKLSLDYEEEFNMYERMRYLEAKKIWEVNDAEWIANKKISDIHNSSHKSIELWEHYKQKQREGCFTYDILIPEIITNTRINTCKLCVNAIAEEKRIEEKQRIEEIEFIKREEEWKLQKEIERKEVLETRELYECKECGFKTYDDIVWNTHEESKDHKKIMELKKFYCEECLVQCRNQMEFSIHIQTKKHKILTGIIEKQTEFKCETCNYITHLKQNYDKHCLTKSHIEK